MKEPVPPSRTEQDDSLEDLELPFLEAVTLRVSVLLIALFTRVTDVLVLCVRPWLLRPYLGVWLAELMYPPYRPRRTFEVTQAVRASGQGFRELIYGETPLLTAVRLFRRAGVGRGSRVVDVGAGRGRVLLAARWLAAEARGVELLMEHVASVVGQLRLAGNTLTVGDATREELGDATHVFANWTALSPKTKARLMDRFRTCHPGTRFIVVTRPIEGPGFVTLSTHRMLFTWGFETVWLQEYRPGPL
ncbi:MAG TPA: class I SAM-dependent methyltransferase [Archangium sp.]|nr:class I SAM-dependent methyltransferase [Archangium sp.]